MSKIALTPNASGTGVFTIASPATNTDRTLTLPDITGTLVSTDASGNVGIGTSSPSTKLQIVQSGGNFAVGSAFAKVENTSGASASLVLADTTDSFALKNIGSALAFVGSSTERMRIDSSGKVGIGTSSPITKLQVKGDNSASGGILLQGTAGSFGLQIYHDGPADTSRIYNYYAGPLLFGTNNSERMRINSTGTLTQNNNGVHSWTETNNSLFWGGGIGVTSNGDWGLQMAGSTTQRIRFFTSNGGSGATVA